MCGMAATGTRSAAWSRQRESLYTGRRNQRLCGEVWRRWVSRIQAASGIGVSIERHQRILGIVEDGGWMVRYMHNY